MNQALRRSNPASISSVLVTPPPGMKAALLPKAFSALMDIIYNLRNVLFLGSITPNEQHHETYKPAYHVVMRLVKCTI